MGNTCAQRRRGCGSAAHPHTRGEHREGPIKPADYLGSSPHAWGTLTNGGEHKEANRLIPTRVGNTSDQSSNAPTDSAHPHVRGEHSTRSSLKRTRRGSSPRAWGTHYCLFEDAVAARLIPTCVGNTGADADARRQSAAHPHVRGEHCCVMPKCAAMSGSSPRAWGTRIQRKIDAVVGRLIPTCVGNTDSKMRLRTSGSAHPHVRGEHGGARSCSRMRRGSSPRAWGTRVPFRHPKHAGRLIPTCVGNTSMDQLAETLPEAHPHVRGEHRRGSARNSRFRGSSPRAWGTLFGSGAGAFEPRLIPTCVGNTPAFTTPPPPPTAHPHVRGEHSENGLHSFTRAGSSPRAWGTLLPYKADHSP